MGQYTLGGRQATLDRPMPLTKPEQSRLILVGTAAVVATVLLGWLLLIRFLAAPGGSRIIARAFGPPDLAARAIPLLAEDCRQIGGEGAGDGTARATWRQFADELRTRMDRQGTEPVVAYFAAVGVSTPGNAYLLPADGSPSAPASMIPLEELLDLFKDRPAVSKLLILDAVQVGSDRDLGVFGNGFVDRLKDLLRKEKYAKLAVLCSCDSGQMSWTSEAAGRSVFGAFVADGLSGHAGRGKLSDLYAYVRPRVYRWVKQNRGASQTPVLLGDDRLDFPLPRLVLPEAGRGASKPGIRPIPDELARRWAQRDLLEKRRPYRHAPRPWRRYQEALLRAEGLVRVGAEADAKEVLASLDEPAKEIEARAGGLPLAPPRSLAMLARALAENPSDPKASRSRIDAYRRTIEDVCTGRGAPDPRAAASDPARPEAAKAPPAPARTPLDEDDLNKTPTFLEGQLPLWFAEFSRRGGASDPDLKERRLDLLRQLVAARDKAEEAAAADERIGRFLRRPIELGDDLRRQAQDYLFAADEPGLARGGSLLSGCAEKYDQAAADAAGLARAVDLLRRAQSDLPYYGEWVARREAGPDPEFEALLEKAAELASLLDRRPSKADDTAAPTPKLRELAEDLSQALDRLSDDFLGRCRRLAGGAGVGSWREVDALLCVPMIPAADRKALLLRAGSPELSRPFADAARGDSPPSELEPDPVSRDRALGLARLEWGLLKLGGLDVADLPSYLEAARAAWKDDPAKAADAFDTFSDRARALRASGARSLLSPAENLDLADDEILQARAAADRLARVLPLPDLARIAASPAEALDRFHRYSLLLWHGHRLLLDGAPKHARLLLDDAMESLGARTPALKAAYAEAGKIEDARLTIAAETTGGANPAGQRTIKVYVESHGDLPAGRAAVLLRHDPAIPLAIAGPDARPLAAEGALFVVPTGGSVHRELRVTQIGLDPKVGPVRLAPEVFYRGQTYAPAEGPKERPAGDLIALRILQQRNSIKVGNRTLTFPDQFEKQQSNGYLHPFHNLDYKVVIRNLTDDKLKLFVTQGLKGQEPATEVVELAPRGVTESVVGRVWSHDFPDEKPQSLTISATEGDKDGRPACKPLSVVFRKVPPKEFITAMEGVALDGNGGGRITVWVTHEDSDPVRMPAEVQVKMEPVGAFREDPAHPALQRIYPGQTAPFHFWIVRRGIAKAKWTVKAEGVPDVVKGETNFLDEGAAPKEPKSPADYPASPGSAPTSPGAPPSY